MNKKIKGILVLSISLLLVSCGPTTSILTSDNTQSVPPTSLDSESTLTSDNEPTSNLTTSEENEKFEESECYVVSESLCFFDLENEIDPYLNVDKEEFYNNYQISTSYVDSYFRSKHGLLSGELIEEDGFISLIEDAPRDEEGVFYKNATARFGVDKDGERISYTINCLDGNDYTIYKCGMYTSINDVCAYLFAFNELPRNYISGTSLKDEAYERYGEIGRLNFNKYTGPSTTKYKYEPYLKGQDDKSLFYREVDFGANIGEDHYYTYQDKFSSNNGRGPFRIVISNSYDDEYTYSKRSETYETPNSTDLDDRYVYYTYNHYNDFQEYLNYYNGFTNTFGNVTAGNEPNDYNSSNPPTQRNDSKLAIFK